MPLWAQEERHLSVHALRGLWYKQEEAEQVQVRHSDPWVTLLGYISALFFYFKRDAPPRAGQFLGQEVWPEALLYVQTINPVYTPTFLSEAHTPN